MNNQKQILNRWRLVLGKYASDALGDVDPQYQQVSSTLDYLYSREYEGRDIHDDTNEGGQGDSDIQLVDWLHKVHTLFPKEAIEKLECHAIERYKLVGLLKDKKVLERLQPNMNLLKQILSLKGSMSPEVLNTAKQIVEQVVSDLKRKLEMQVKQSIVGQKNKNQSSNFRYSKNLDLKKTVRKNLKNWNQDEQQIGIDKVYFNSNSRPYNNWNIVICVDESGSMMDSVIHSAVMAAIFAKLPMISTKLVIFETSIDIDLETIAMIQEFVTSIFDTGLARLAPNTKAQIEHLAILAHSKKLAHIENLCNRIVTQLDYIETRSTRANTTTLLSYLCELTNTCKALQAGQTDQKYIGRFKDEYTLIPPTTLIGLGAEGWQSSNYIGITIYFYSPDRQEIVQTVSVLPKHLEDRLPQLYNKHDSKYIDQKIDKTCRSTLLIRLAKMNDSKTISLGQESIVSILHEKELDYHTLAIDDFAILPDLIWDEANHSRPIILAPSAYHNYTFDAVHQQASIDIIDKNGITLSIGFVYNDLYKVLLQNMQKFMSIKDDCECILVKAYVSNGLLKLFPLVLYSHNPNYKSAINNLTLDIL